MARKFHVAGTRVYLQIAVGLLVLGLWCVKDGWFPSREVLSRHEKFEPPQGPESFYIFNRSLAIISLTGAAICGYIHRIVR